MRTVRDLLLESAAKHGSRTALQTLRNGDYYAVTFSDFSTLAGKVSAFLAEQGLATGDRVGILGANSPEWAIAYMACQMQGFIAIPIDRLLKTGEIKHIISDSGLKVLFADDKYLDDMAAISKSLNALKHVYPLTPGYEDNIYMLAEKCAVPDTLPEISPDAPAEFLYTSGTTGKTKGVMLTHRNLIANVESINKKLEINSEDRMLSILPLHHAYEGTAGFLVPVSNGTLITFCPSFLSRDIIRSMKDVGITKMIGVPLIFEKMYEGVVKNLASAKGAKKAFINMLFLAGRVRRLYDKSPNGTKKIFKPLLVKAGFYNIVFFVAGGAALPPHINKFFYLLGIPVLHGYGLTETSPVISVVDPQDIDFYSVGQPLEGIKVRIFNPDENGIGEIVIRGDSVMAGYYNEPQKTDDVLKRGWFYTGDFGYLDDKGRINIKGRLKNVIVSKGGKNIYPEEIEEILIESDYIEEILVIGKDQPEAIVYPNYEYIESWARENGVDEISDDKTLELIRDDMARFNEKLAQYKRVNKITLRKEEFPKTSTRKIKRFLFMGEPQETEN